MTYDDDFRLIASLGDSPRVTLFHHLLTHQWHRRRQPPFDALTQLIRALLWVAWRKRLSFCEAWTRLRWGNFCYPLLTVNQHAPEQLALTAFSQAWVISSAGKTDTKKHRRRWIKRITLTLDFYFETKCFPCHLWLCSFLLRVFQHSLVFRDVNFLNGKRMVK